METIIDDASIDRDYPKSSYVQLASFCVNPIRNEIVLIISRNDVCENSISVRKFIRVSQTTRDGKMTCREKSVLSRLNLP